MLEIIANYVKRQRVGLPPAPPLFRVSYSFAAHFADWATTGSKGRDGDGDGDGDWDLAGVRVVYNNPQSGLKEVASSASKHTKLLPKCVSRFWLPLIDMIGFAV